MEHSGSTILISFPEASFVKKSANHQLKCWDLYQPRRFLKTIIEKNNFISPIATLCLKLNPLVITWQTVWSSRSLLSFLVGTAASLAGTFRTPTPHFWDTRHPWRPPRGPDIPRLPPCLPLCLPLWLQWLDQGFKDPSKRSCHGFLFCKRYKRYHCITIGIWLPWYFVYVGTC